MENVLGLLIIGVRRGINLAVRDIGSSDPYVIITSGRQASSYFSFLFFYVYILPDFCQRYMPFNHFIFISFGWFKIIQMFWAFESCFPLRGLSFQKKFAIIYLFSVVIYLITDWEKLFLAIDWEVKTISIMFLNFKILQCLSLKIYIFLIFADLMFVG